jgi:hypothetical protein
MPESNKYYINAQPLKMQNYIRFNELLMGICEVEVGNVVTLQEF